MIQRRTAKSTCPLDCPDACSLDVTLDAGRISAIDGNQVNPLTEGYICGKVRNFAERVYHETRLLHPLVRRVRAAVQLGLHLLHELLPFALGLAEALVAERLPAPLQLFPLLRCVVLVQHVGHLDDLQELLGGDRLLRSPPPGYGLQTVAQPLLQLDLLLEMRDLELQHALG